MISTNDPKDYFDWCASYIWPYDTPGIMRDLHNWAKTYNIEYVATPYPYNPRVYMLFFKHDRDLSIFVLKFSHVSIAPMESQVKWLLKHGIRHNDDV